MSKYLNAALLAGLVVSLGFLYYLHFSAAGMVYVDSARILNQYQGMIDARQVYQQKSIGWKGNIDTLTSEVRKSIYEYEKNSSGMSEKERSLAQELIRTKQRQLADFQKAINEKASQEDAQMTSQVLKQVNAYLKKYGKEHNFKIIFAATDYGNIAYAEEGIDVTGDVIEGLNKEYSGK